MELLKIIVIYILPVFMFFCTVSSFFFLRKSKSKTFEIPVIFFAGILIGHFIAKFFSSDMVQSIVFVVGFILTGLLMLVYSIYRYKQFKGQ